MSDVITIKNDNIEVKLDSMVNCFAGKYAKQFLKELEKSLRVSRIDYTHVKPNSGIVETQLVILVEDELIDYDEKLDYFNNDYNIVVAIGRPACWHAATYTINKIGDCLVATMNNGV